MASVDEIPAWLKLHRRLVTLQDGVGATNVIVSDAAGHLLCHGLSRRAHDGADPRNRGAEADRDREVRALGEIFDRTLRTRPLAKDDTLAMADEEPFTFVQSFGGNRLLLLWFNGPFTPFPVALKVRGALPAIEALAAQIPAAEESSRGAAV